MILFEFRHDKRAAIDGEGMTSGRAHHFQFLARPNARLASPRRAQGLPHPFARRHLLTARGLLDLCKFLVLRQHL